MSYCNVWAEVVFVVLQKVNVYKNLNMPIPCALPNVYVLRLVRIANSEEEEDEQFRK